MNETDLRLECVRIASENLRQLMSTTSRSIVESDAIVDRVTVDAKKLYEFIRNLHPLKVAA